MGEVVAISQHNKWAGSEIELPKHLKLISDTTDRKPKRSLVLQEIKDKLDEEDYLEFLEGALDHDYYQCVEEEIQDIIDNYFFKRKN